jgi:hypothetical protein
MQIYAGTVTNFGKQLLKLERECQSPGEMSKKAKLITSIQLGDPVDTQKSIEMKNSNMTLQDYENEVRQFQSQIPSVTNQLKKVLA